jgi:uncharacterized membrane protein YciS (DUF1049 family)
MLLMLRYLLYIVTILITFLIAVIFAASNPGSIELDLAFTSVVIQKSLALIMFLGLGWVFGLFCAGVLLLKSAGEKRHLRKALNLAEAEVRSLRSMPLQDAD